MDDEYEGSMEYLAESIEEELSLGGDHSTLMLTVWDWLPKHDSIIRKATIEEVAKLTTAFGSSEFANNVNATWADGEPMKLGERIAASFACMKLAGRIRALNEGTTE